MVTEAEATAWVAMECQVTSEPCLTAEEVQHLVHAARRADADGRPPADSAWVPTYDLNWAAWRGWRLKAARALLYVDVSGEGSNVSKSQVHAHALAMAAEFARGVATGASLTPDLGEWAVKFPESNATTDTGGPGSLDEPGVIPGVTYP